MLDSFCATKQHRIVAHTSIADTSSDFAQDDGRGNENYEIGLPTVSQLLRSANVLSQMNARQIFRVFSGTLPAAYGPRVVSPKRDKPAVLCPERRQSRPPASSTDDDGFFHFRSKRG